MNYWLLTTEYPPFFGGGISTYCYQTSCMLSTMGHKVTVFVSDKTVKHRKIDYLAEARIIRFNPDFSEASSFLGSITRLSFEFAKLVREIVEQEGKPDVIESQDYNGIAYFLLQSKACLSDWCIDIPILLTLHSPAFLYMEYNQVFLYKKPNYWIGEMERFCIQSADLIISPSQYLIHELQQRFKINSNVRVVPNPYQFVDTLTDESFSDATVLNNKLTFYGKLSPQKGTFKILEEFQKRWEKGREDEFTMIGGQDIVFEPAGETMGAIIKKQYAKYIKRGILKLRDKIPPSERVDFLKESMIFIIPSIVDNLPYVVMELMSQGKILIVSQQGGQSEIISTQEDGFIFDYDQPGSFEKVLDMVLSLEKAERLRIAGQAVKKIAACYSYDAIYPQKIKWIEQLKQSHKLKKQFPFIRTLPVKVKQEADEDFTNTLLSVVIPYYNLGAYIDETIQSVLNSTYKDLEIILVNDGSTDSASIAQLNKYRTHSLIRIIDKVNTGLADTRNKGAEEAKGAFLAFLDADDKVATEYYEKAVKILRQYENVHFVGAWTQYFGDSNSVWPTFNPEPPLLLIHNLINSSALVYKKAAYLSGGKNDINFKIGLEDYESVVQMKANGLNGVAIPEVLFNYRVRKNSMIKKSTKTVRAAYYNKIKAKHFSLFSDFKEEVWNLRTNGLPLSYDNSTLDNLPFQNVPFLGAMVRKAGHLIKSNPRLKNSVLLLKKVLSWR